MSPKPHPVSHILILLACLVVRSAGATEALRPPCGVPQMPDYPVAIGAPVVRSESVTGWAPPACLGWGASAPTLLVAITGRLHEAGGATALLARFGAISRLRGLRYWSVTDQTWQTLIIDAFAVTDAGGRSRRGDFRPDEMAPGASLHAAERDGRAAEAVIYRMQVIERSADRVVVSVVNATPVRAFKVTLFAPGALRTTYFLDRLGPNEWGFYGLWGVTTGLLTGGHAASSINRAMALYRHFARIPDDQEPPAAQH
jgi:hypothetical protein